MLNSYSSSPMPSTVPRQLQRFSTQQEFDMSKIINTAMGMGMDPDTARRISQLYIKNMPPDPQKQAVQKAMFGPKASKGKMI